MLQDGLPVGQVQHLCEVVFNDIWTFWDCVQNEVAGEPDADLLENERSLSDHKHWKFFHFVERAKSLSLFLGGVLGDHGDLGILALEESL